ncbi:hypothetical protein QA601_05215, partial [Chitinispirillales bacterium ANBcel5]|uniref:hypothetical protein n=1 Tax=Cellulosispirillum alkaliphilum TaxID=3039283 RepID=UPI002A58E10F|nr:hypothetical protein [Chitinispirillales bacterium ANBcel5]
MSYPMRFGNYQRNGFMNGQCRAKGEIDWLLPMGPPRTRNDILTDDNYWYLQDGDKLVRFTLEPDVVWSERANALIIEDGLVYYDRGSNLFTISKEKIISNVGAIAGSFIGANLFFMPQADQFLLQTLKRPIGGQPGMRSYTWWRFVVVEKGVKLSMRNLRDQLKREATKRELPALLTSDNNTLILVTGAGGVHHIDPKNVEEISSYNIKDCEVMTASIDMFDNLLIFGKTRR